MKMLGGTGWCGMFACLIIMTGGWFYAVNNKDKPVDQVTMEAKALMPSLSGRVIHIQKNEVKTVTEELPLLGFLSAVHGKEVFAHAPLIVACVTCSHTQSVATICTRKIEPRPRSGPHTHLLIVASTGHRLSMIGGARHLAYLSPRLI